MGLSVLAVGLRWTRVDAGECRHDLGRRNGNIVRVQVDREERRHRWFLWRKLCPMPPATVNPGSMSFTPRRPRDAVTAATRAAALSPPSKIQAAAHQASLKRKIKNDSAHCWWASIILYGECRIEELKTAGPCDRPPHEGVLPWR